MSLLRFYQQRALARSVSLANPGNSHLSPALIYLLLGIIVAIVLSVASMIAVMLAYLIPNGVWLFIVLSIGTASLGMVIPVAFLASLMAGDTRDELANYQSERTGVITPRESMFDYQIDYDLTEEYING